MNMQVDNSVSFVLFAILIMIISIAFDDYEKIKLTSIIGVIMVFSTMIIFSIYSLI